jgi:predicted nucleic acid-binding protein
MNVFLDTSALIKLYHREAGTERLITFLTSPANDIRIIVSDLTRIEFRSAIFRKMRQKEIEPEEAMRVIGIFESDMSRFDVIEIGARHKAIAINLFDVLGPKSLLRSLDALQLATAVSVNYESKIAHFICSDTGLTAIAASYFNVFNPETV